MFRFLQNNRLTQISAKVFDSNKLLTELRLENNALICNCQLLWLKKIGGKVSHLSATCDSPNDLKSKLIPQIPDYQFRCNEPVFSIDIRVLPTVSSDQIILECKVEGEVKTVEWFHDNKRIDLNYGHIFYNISDNGFKLVIKAKSNEIRGNYQCIARNFVEAISSPQKWINSSNELSEVKQNQIIEPFGSRLALNCSNFEHKFWTKNEQRIDDKHYNKRLKMAKNGSLIIKHVLTTDSAVYKCVDRLNQSFESYSLKVSGNISFI